MRLFIFFISLFRIVSFPAQDSTQIVKGDTIVLRSQIKLIVKVLENDSVRVKYRKMNNLEGPTYFTRKADIVRISFSNGSIDNVDSVFSVKRALKKGQPVLASYTENDKVMYDKGIRDAQLHYTYQLDAVSTGVVSCLFGALGLVPAIINTTKPVPDKHLGTRDPELWGNNAYRAGYKKQAQRIRVKRVWTGFGVGLGSGIVISLMILPKN